MKKLCKFIALSILITYQTAHAVVELSPEYIAAENTVAAQEFGIPDYQTYETASDRYLRSARTYQDYYEKQATSLETKAKSYRDLGFDEEANRYDKDAKDDRDTADKYKEEADTIESNLKTLTSYIAGRAIGETPVVDRETAQTAQTAIDTSRDDLVTLIRNDEVRLSVPEITPTPTPEPTPSPTPEPTPTPTPQPEQSLLKSWFNNTFTRVVNAVREFFRMKEKPSAADVTPETALAPEPIPPVDDDALQQAFDATWGDYQRWIGVFGSEAALQEWIDKMLPLDSEKAKKGQQVLTTYRQALRDLEAARSNYLNELTHAVTTASQTLADNLASFASEPDALANTTAADVRDVANDLNTTTINNERQKAIDEQFKASFNFDNPYTTLGITQTGEPPLTALTSALEELKVPLATITTLNGELVAGNIDFETFKKRLADTLSAANPQAYAQDAEQLFRVVDAYNLLNNTYLGSKTPERTFTIPDAPELGTSPYGATYVDRALANITNNFAKIQQDHNASYTQITGPVQNVISGAQTTTRNLYEALRQG